MPAAQIAYWDYDRDGAIACPGCGWSGPASKGEDFHGGLLDVTCPQCSKMLLIVPFPTVAETRAAAKDGNARAQAELPSVDRVQKRWGAAAAVALTDSRELPEIDNNEITVVWDFEKRDGEVITILRHDEKVLWRELAYWEGIDRFEKVATLLERRYGPRLAAIEPSPSSEIYLYGDLLAAPRRVDAVNARIRSRRASSAFGPGMEYDPLADASAELREAVASMGGVAFLAAIHELVLDHEEYTVEWFDVRYPDLGGVNLTADEVVEWSLAQLARTGPNIAHAALDVMLRTFPVDEEEVGEEDEVEESGGVTLIGAFVRVVLGPEIRANRYELDFRHLGDWIRHDAVRFADDPDGAHTTD